MCRFLVYKGSEPILLSKLILDPSHSILTQSFDCRLRLDMRRPHNGDGFGIGYYTDPALGPEPCIFTSTTPAWNCKNLQRIASKTASNLIFAHVRASTEGSLSEDNCHPFTHSSLTWMHNGGLGGWQHIKRPLGNRLSDKWYLGVKGRTDSEWAFALYLDTLERMGDDPSSPPPDGFGPNVLRYAMLNTIKQINDFIAGIDPDIIAEEDVDTRSLLNFAITDGHSVVCTRYVSSKTDEAASLYYSSGTTWEDKSNKGDYQMDRRDKGADIVLVASEPLTFERESWVTVPTNSTLTIHKQTVMVHPIIDEYYNYNPAHSRSSKYVENKGLVTNEKPSISPQPTPGLSNGENKKPTAILRETIANSLNAATRASPLILPRETKPNNSDLRHLTLSRDVILANTRNAEQGNTKKKRAPTASDLQLPPMTRTHAQLRPETPASPDLERNDRSNRSTPSFGDPAKIAQYFPELHYASSG